MAISKLILNGEVQMDVTSDTVAAGSLLSGKTATKNDGTKVTGTIASKSSSDLTVSGATVTAPAGYYANAASKAVTTTTHPNPTAAITSSTGVVTASHTQDTGYVTGGTTTGTLNLTTQAGKTVTPTESAQTAVASYRWTTGPISVAAISSTYVGTGVTTRSSANLTASGSVVTAPAGYYSTAATKSIAAGSAFPPAVTITKAPTIGVNTSGVVTASYTGSSSITPTVTSGYISQGTAGTISTTGTSTYQLTSKAAATYYPSTADQTIASQRWLVGNQTIKSVTTSNLTAANIAEGVTVKVGDSSNASRITQVTGTHKSGEDLPIFTITFASDYTTIASITCNKTYNEVLSLFNNNYISAAIVKYVEPDNTIEISGLHLSAIEGGVYGDRIVFYGGATDGVVYEQIRYYSDGSIEHDWNAYALTSLTVTSNGTYSSASTYYNEINVSVQGGGYTADQIAARSISGAISGNATTIGNYAFASCYNLTTASFSKVTSIGASGFCYCSALSYISFPICLSVGQYGFIRTSLTDVNFPVCEYIGGSAFRECSNLTTASFPVCITLGTEAFSSCGKLTTAYLPMVQSIGGSAFRNCSSLTTLSFQSVSYIGAYAFQQCYRLLSLYLLGSSIPSLYNTYVFSSTPISTYTTYTGGVYGSIFVPSSLYNSYLTASIWSIYSSRIVSV